MTLDQAVFAVSITIVLGVVAYIAFKLYMDKRQPSEQPQEAGIELMPIGVLAHPGPTTKPYDWAADNPRDCA